MKFCIILLAYSNCNGLLRLVMSILDLEYVGVDIKITSLNKLLLF